MRSTFVRTVLHAHAHAHLHVRSQADLNERDAQLCFVWSRMRTIDEQHDKSRIKMTHLSFEDFLEALCRLARLKAYPTDVEIEKAGVPDAPSYLAALAAEDMAAYDLFMRDRSAPWGQPVERDRQPVDRFVEHLCHSLIWQVQGGTKRTASDYRVSEGQLKSYMKASALS